MPQSVGICFGSGHDPRASLVGGISCTTMASALELPAAPPRAQVLGTRILPAPAWWLPELTVQQETSHWAPPRNVAFGSRCAVSKKYTVGLDLL